jgi:nucleoside-diphosphate-sugar epimerase
MTQGVLNIGVIGGSGFIGSRLVTALLSAGHQVRIYDKAASSVHPSCVTLGDVRDGAALSRFVGGCELLINLAAEHADDVRPQRLYHEVNAGGAEQLVKVAGVHGIDRVIYVSSVAVYGLHQPLADEQAALRPDNEYGRSKVAAEAVYRGWAAEDPRRGLLILRPVVVFGEGNRGNVHTLVEQLLRGRFRMVGDGSNRKSMAYVGNLVDFMQAQLWLQPGVRIYNYADKPDLSMRELIDCVAAMLPQGVSIGRSVPYPLAMLIGRCFDALAWLSGRQFVVSSARVRKFCADTRIATALLQRTGFVARTSLAEGLQRMLAHLLECERSVQR